MKQNRVFKVLSESLKYENPWMKVIEYETETDGRKGIYGIVERDNSAIIIIENVEGAILFVKQYRYPIHGDSWELPMGGLQIHRRRKFSEPVLFFLHSGFLI